MPSVRAVPSRGSYGRLVMRTSQEDDDDDEDGSPLTPVGAAKKSKTRGTTITHIHGPSSKKLCSILSHAVKNIIVFSMTNIVASIFLVLVAFGLSLGPGLYCLLVLEPKMMIDKSIKAFNIPNHQVSKNQDALDKAYEDLIKHNRGKRSLRALNMENPSKHLNHKNIFINNIVADPYKGWSHSEGDDNSKLIDVLLHDDESQQTVRHAPISHIESQLDKMLRTLYSDDETAHFEQELLHRDNKNFRVKRNADMPEKYSSITQAYRRWKMQVVYLADGNEDPNNIFTRKRLETIHKIERKIMEHPGFQDHCLIHYSKWKEDPNLSQYGGCAPLNSLLTYFYPSVTSDGVVHYDGLGDRLDQIDRTLKFAMTRDTFFWYVDDKINASYHKSRLLRTEVHFGAPLPGYRSISDRKEEQINKFKKFVISYIDMLEKSSTPDVKVLYGGNDIFDYEVDSTFWNDLSLAIYALVFIALLMFVLTSGSVWLTFWGIISIILSFPLALFYYRYIFNIITLGILNGAAAFVIIGIGVDDVFVFVNTFRQAYHITDLGERMWHMLLTAGKATFFTSFTTAAAFAANIASSIPAVHEFGLFMSLIVACCWCMVVLIMPPVINLWYRFFACCESACYGSCFHCSSPSCLALPPDVTHILDQQHSLSSDSSSQGSGGSQTGFSTSEDTGYASGGGTEDVPMLNCDKVNDHEEMLYDDEEDDPLLQLENELLTTEFSNDDEGLKNEGCGLTEKFQGFLYHFVAKPVVRARWVVLVLYIGILIISVGLMTQLRPATKPPQLFKSETNLQQLMDLAANFSASAIKCDECSGFYKENPVMPVTPFNQITAPSRTNPIGMIPDLETSIYNTERTSFSTTGTTTTTTTTTTATTSKTTTTTTTRSRTTTSLHSPQTTTRPSSTVAKTSTTPPLISKTTMQVDSVDINYDPCAGGKCDDVKPRPNLELGAAIYVVFGIRGIDRSNVSYKHVLQEKGEVVYDPVFQNAFAMKDFSFNIDALRDLCKLCKYIANNTELVRPNGSQCLPHYGMPPNVKNKLQKIPECQDLPENRLINGRRLPARAKAGMSGLSLLWLAFAFESTTYKGQSYFTAYKEYQRWEEFIRHIQQEVLPKDSPLQGLYQTSEFWKNVIMEIVAVSSAIYGLLLSMVICVAAVAIFTGHVLLLIIVCLTITGVICLVVAIFYVAGWEMGAVEAVSLSILVGSSVDYCVHLVEGYLLAGKNPPPSVKTDSSKLRQWRTLVAISHIGISITSSAITTIIAAIPLTRTVIQPFSKFGQIVAINTTVSITYTLTACVAFLSIMAPPRFTANMRAALQMALGTSVVIGGLILVLFIASKCGVAIPSPSGQNLFPN